MSSPAARRLTVIFTGSSVRTVVQDQPLHALAVTTATTLLDAAGASGEGLSTWSRASQQS
ncbi:hypothetical protein ABZT28_29750 [Streptomyces sp. NPDC005388]|uniref:hypothetical protein n=1 Tax=Streptomyces sp. NPDC005388 TaxID=3156717 RepID=UPI0033B3ADD1